MIYQQSKSIPIHFYINTQHCFNMNSSSNIHTCYIVLSDTNQPAYLWLIKQEITGNFTLVKY